MKNSTEAEATVDNTLRDLQKSSYPTKAEFNNYFIVHSKYLPFLKGVLPFRSLFFCLSEITQSPFPIFFRSTFQLSAVGYTLTSFSRHWFNNVQRAALLTSVGQYDKVLSNFGQQQLVMMNYASGLSNQKRENILNE